MSSQSGNTGGGGSGGTTPNTTNGGSTTQDSKQQSAELLYHALKRQAEGQDAAAEGGSAKKPRPGAEEGKEAAVTTPSSHVVLPRSEGLQGSNSVLALQVSSLGESSSQPSLASNILMNDQLMRAELHARQLQEMTASRNAALVATLLGQNQGRTMPYPPFQQHLSFQGQATGAYYGGSPVDNFLTGLLHRNQASNTGIPSAHSLPHQLQPHAHMLGTVPVDINAVLRQLTWPSTGLRPSPHALEAVTRSTMGATHSGTAEQGLQASGAFRLPACEEGSVPPYTEREKFPLGVDEDPNWLSEFHCFVRSELVEVCRASHEECKTRNNATSFQQVGIRCRFCAHRPPTARGCRSSAYPSSIRQIYQSFTMMLRDHFGSCESMPTDTKQRFLALKDKPSQGATDSKRYWIYSAVKAGLSDSPEGIIMNQHTVLAGMSAPPFGSEDSISWQRESAIARPLVAAGDASLGNSFVQLLLLQAQLIQLRESERIGNRRSLEPGLPGFSCRFCWEKRRLGLCRMFPARRRTLLQKLNDLHDHLRRCSAAPDVLKEELGRRRSELGEDGISDTGEMKALLDRVWIRLGHGG